MNIVLFTQKERRLLGKQNSVVQFMSRGLSFHWVSSEFRSQNELLWFLDFFFFFPLPSGYSVYNQYLYKLSDTPGFLFSIKTNGSCVSKKKYNCIFLENSIQKLLQDERMWKQILLQSNVL